jgi:hypothetical protein
VRDGNSWIQSFVVVVVRFLILSVLSVAAWGITWWLARRLGSPVKFGSLMYIAAVIAMPFNLILGILGFSRIVSLLGGLLAGTQLLILLFLALLEWRMVTVVGQLHWFKALLTLLIPTLLVGAALAASGEMVSTPQQFTESVLFDRIAQRNVEQPLPSGYQRYHGQGMSIDLPDTYIGTDPASSEMDGILSQLKQNGNLDLVAFLTRLRKDERFVFWAYNHQAGSDGARTTIAVFRFAGEPGDTLEAQVDSHKFYVYKECKECAIGTDRIKINGFDGFRVNAVSQWSRSRQMTYLTRANGYYWMVSVNSSTTTMANDASIIEASILTIVFGRYGQR